MTTYSVEILDVELKIVDLDVLFLLILKPAESLYLLSLLTAWADFLFLSEQLCAAELKDWENRGSDFQALCVFTPKVAGLVHSWGECKINIVELIIVVGLVHTQGESSIDIAGLTIVFHP